MHKSFVKFLKCPLSEEDLKLNIIEENNDEIITGKLINKSKNINYEIINGIPRFVSPKNYSKSFGMQWKKWSRVQFDRDNIGKPMENYTSKMLNRITELDKENLKDKKILEIGCGSGRFLDVLSDKNCFLFGIDNSASIDETKKNLDFMDKKKILLLQCDTYNLPFKNNLFDHIFSIGVLHHTPKPDSVIAKIYDLIKNKGSFSFSVYNKNSYYDLPNVNFWRKLFNFLSPIFSFYPAMIYSYFTIFLLRPITKIHKIFDLIIRIPFPFCNEPDFKWSLLDTFDSVTPKYQSTHETYEVYMWLKKNKFLEIKPTNWGAASFKGYKL